MAYETIINTMAEILAERGDKCPPLNPQTRISDTGLDSLDVASLVVRLQSSLGLDPFADGTLTSFPQTIGELSHLYEGARRPS